MAWTDERVEILKKLWRQGLSASQIALQIGGDVSRNGVIGKIHRLGLAGRKTTVRMSNPYRNRKPKPKPQNQKMQFAQQRSAVSAVFSGSQEPVAYEPELVIPMKERKTISTLGEGDCKWPIGDPQHEDFHFCGKKQHPGLVYCSYHAARAYQPPDARRRPHAPQSVAGGQGQSRAHVSTSEASSASARKLEVVK